MIIAMIKIAATHMSDSGKVDYIMKLVPLGDRVVIKALDRKTSCRERV